MTDRRGLRIARLGVVAAVLLCAQVGAAGERTSNPIPSRGDRELLLLGHARLPPERSDTASRAAVLAAQDAFDVTHYLLDLDFDTSSRIISGTVTITATSLVATLDEVVLDLAPEMQVAQVGRDGVSLDFSHQGDVLTVTLDPPVPAPLSFTIEVTYAGSPRQRPPFDGFGWNKYTSGAGSMAWSLSQPDNARIWWPGKDRPDDKALVDEWWTVEPSFTATGNGVLLGVDTLGNGRKRFRYRATHPLTTYLVSVAATDYVTFSQTYTALDGSTMPIDHYVYAEQLTQAEESFAAVPEMMSAFAQLFGEYPFVEDKYGMSAFPFGGAMEHSTNTSYGYPRINGGHGNDFIVAHELAHQWFGDSVTPETWKDIWLSEGFASYGEALWREWVDGPTALTSYMGTFERDRFSGTLYDPVAPFNVIVFDKGAWVLHMLRRLLGDPAFFAGLRSWHAVHRDGNGNTAQFQAAMEAFHGLSLDGFFTQWVYGEGLPDYRFGYRVAHPAPDRYEVWVRLRQVQTDAPAFSVPVDLTFVTPSGRIGQSVWNSAAEQYYRLVVDEPVTDVLFDEANWLIEIDATREYLSDVDADGVPDGVDNCLTVANPDQYDDDNDHVGNRCDGVEICDDAIDNDSDDATDCDDPQCDGVPACIAVVCGDGFVGAGEQCDDGNLQSGDGCQADCTVPSDRLPSMYSFEGEGDIVRDAANGNDGQLIPGAQRTDDGRYGAAAVFDGVAGHVDLGTLNLGGPFTLAFWFRAHDFETHDARMISKGTSVAEQDHYFMVSTIGSAGSRLRFRLKTSDGGTATLIADGATVPTETWVHVAAVWDGSFMRLYQNGAEVGSLPKTGTLLGSATVPTWLGDQPGGGRPFDGEIDEMLIDRRAYGADEIADLMNGPLPEDGSTCGNGFLDLGEYCDDGNDVDDDACRSDCTRPNRGGLPRPVVHVEHL